MTAAEFYKKSIYDAMDVDAEKVEHDFKMPVEEFKQRHVEAIMKISTHMVQRMRDYAKLKCEEQRRICYENVPPRLCMKTTIDGTQVGVLILNSPEPEI